MRRSLKLGSKHEHRAHPKLFGQCSVPVQPTRKDPLHKHRPINCNPVHPHIPKILIKGKGFTLSAFTVTHRGAGCFGFTFEEETRSRFDNSKAEALGIPAGPERRELVARRPVTLADGRTVQPEEVLGEPQKGVKLCFVGDVGRTGPLHKLVADADLLAIEATYLEEERELAKNHGHITALAAARLALKAGVKQLVLHHISRRYRARDVLEEAQAVFPNTVVAGDLDTFQVRKGKPVKWKAGPKYVVR